MLDSLSSLWFKWILFNKQSGFVIDYSLVVLSLGGTQPVTLTGEYV